MRSSKERAGGLLCHGGPACAAPLCPRCLGGAFCSQNQSGKESSAAFGGAVSSHPVSCREDKLFWLQVAFRPTLCSQTVPAALVAGAGELCNPPLGLVCPLRPSGVQAMGRQRVPLGCGCWGRLAEHCARCVAPGSSLGRLPPGKQGGPNPNPSPWRCSPCRAPVAEMGPYKIPCPMLQQRGQSGCKTPWLPSSGGLLSALRAAGFAETRARHFEERRSSLGDFQMLRAAERRPVAGFLQRFNAVVTTNNIFRYAI